MKFQSGPVQHSAFNLLRALLISLLLHALVLWQPPSAIPGGIMQSAAVSPVPSLQASWHARPESQVLTSTVPEKQTVKSLAVPQMLKPPAARPPLETAPAQPVVMARAASLAASTAETGIDANGMRQYRLSLATAARRYKVYPAQAVENGWSGTAEVAVAIAADGVPQPVQLLNSSGYAVLDAAALEMIAGAAVNTVVPASLRGQRFSVALPVVFERNPGQ